MPNLEFRTCTKCGTAVAITAFFVNRKRCSRCAAHDRKVAEKAKALSNRFRQLGLDSPAAVSQAREAALEGRLPADLALEIGVKTGTHRCGTCGMRCWTPQEAFDCCRVMIEECGQ